MTLCAISCIVMLPAFNPYDQSQMYAHCRQHDRFWLTGAHSRFVPTFILCFILGLHQIGSGVLDLVLLPVNQYQREGKLWRALSRGASTFARTLSVETLQIVSQLALQAQTLLEAVDRAFAPSAPTSESGPSRALIGGGARSVASSARSSASSFGSAADRSRWTQQPRTSREGFRMVCTIPCLLHLHELSSWQSFCTVLLWLHPFYFEAQFQPCAPFLQAGCGVALSRHADCRQLYCGHPDGGVRARRHQRLYSVHGLPGRAPVLAAPGTGRRASSVQGCAWFAQRIIAWPEKRVRGEIQGRPSLVTACVSRMFINMYITTIID